VVAGLVRLDPRGRRNLDQQRLANLGARAQCYNFVNICFYSKLTKMLAFLTQITAIFALKIVVF
jgi:hypothetical protein